jgi:signal transduction histidine kinase
MEGVELNVDYMDTKRMETPAYLDQLDTLFGMKYGKSPVDAVIAVDDQAYQFFLQRGLRIWGDVPMAFCGVNRFADSAIRAFPKVSGVVEKGYFRANVEFALRARPNARRIHVIADSTQTGLSNLKELRSVLVDFPQLSEVLHQNVTLSELQSNLENGRLTDFGFFISFWKDRLGQVVDPDSLGHIFRHGAIPIFGRSEWMIGKGETGGLCVSGRMQGATAANKLLALRSASPGVRVPVRMESPNVFLFDDSLLRQHRIPQDLIPAGSHVVNRPPSFLQVKWSTVVFALAIMGAFAALLVFSLVNYYRRVRLSKKLEKTVLKLENKNNELERYAYTVSHDLRSPLVSILGFATEMKTDLAEGEFDGASQDADRIIVAAKKMSQLLSGILQFSRVEHFARDPVQFSLFEVVDEVLETMIPLATRRGISIQVDDRGMSPRVRADRQHILEVMQYLIENAIKYSGSTPQSLIRIYCHDEGPYVRMTVEDQGIGIAPAHLHKVFGLFNKLDARSEGLGLGLALVKRIVEHNGGQVRAESLGLGHGAKFSFTLLR